MKESTLRIRVASRRAITIMNESINEALASDAAPEAKIKFIDDCMNSLIETMHGYLPVAETHTGIENVFKCIDEIAEAAATAKEKI